MSNDFDIAIIDLGISNVSSVKNMLAKIGFSSEVQTEPSEVACRKIYIIPGVGSFDEGVRQLRQRQWDVFLADAAKKEIPILGLCLGMQLLCQSSEEGALPGLGIIGGHFKKFSDKSQDGKLRKVPHMGWNSVDFVGSGKDWIRLGSAVPRYYFVHSYFFSDINSKSAVGFTSYGEQFVSAIQSGSVIGLQFHPEKSHKFGEQILDSIILKLHASL